MEKEEKKELDFLPRTVICIVNNCPKNQFSPKLSNSILMISFRGLKIVLF